MRIHGGVWEVALQPATAPPTLACGSAAACCGAASQIPPPTVTWPEKGGGQLNLWLAGSGKMQKLRMSQTERGKLYPRLLSLLSLSLCACTCLSLFSLCISLYMCQMGACVTAGKLSQAGGCPAVVQLRLHRTRPLPLCGQLGCQVAAADRRDRCVCDRVTCMTCV